MIQLCANVDSGVDRVNSARNVIDTQRFRLARASSMRSSELRGPEISRAEKRSARQG